VPPFALGRCAGAWRNPSNCLEVQRPPVTDAKVSYFESFLHRKQAFLVGFNPQLCSVMSLASLRESAKETAERKSCRNVINHITWQGRAPASKPEGQIHLEDHRFAVWSRHFVRYHRHPDEKGTATISLNNLWASRAPYP